MSELSAHEPCSAQRLLRIPSVPRPARTLACGLLALLLGASACGKKSATGSAENAPGKSTSTDGFPDSYVPPAPEGRFTEIEEVEDRGKTLLRYKVEITNSTAFPKKWFKGAPDLPSVGAHSTASRCVIEVVAPGDKVLQQFAEAERDLRMPVWFAVPPGSAVPETVRIVIHDRQTKQRYQSEPIELPQPDPNDPRFTATSPEEETTAASTGKPKVEPDAKENPSEAEHITIKANDGDLTKMAGKLVEVTMIIREAQHTKTGGHLNVIAEGGNLMLFCHRKSTAKVFGEGDPFAKLAAGTRLKVRGKIALFGEQPQIVLRSADQLVEIEAGAGAPEIGEEVGKEE